MYGSSSTPLSSVLRACARRPVLLLLVPVIFGLIVTGAFDADLTPTDGVRDLCPYECAVIPVSVTFDDGYDTQYTAAFPIMQQIDKDYNIRLQATFYVITDLVNDPGHMTLQQLQDLRDYGYEIGAHTVTHPDLTLLSPEDLTKELTDSRAWLEKKGFEVFTMAAPYGNVNPSVIDAMRPLYYGNRGVTTGLNDIPLRDPANDAYNLKAVPFEGSMTVEEAKGWVDKAFAEHKWLIFLLHRVADPITVSEAQRPYTTDPSDLDEVLRYVAEKAKDYETRWPTEMPSELPTVVPLPLDRSE
jgi:peptidoglycan/xylan/chitin deacetylase (PgdA/CDA1 family)